PLNCDDGNPSTIDTCRQAGCCIVDQDCADKVCMQKRCDRPTNSCAYTPTPDVACGGGCQGSQLAVRPGTCNESGECCDAGGVCPPRIDACPEDEDFCTDDICLPEARCVHRPIPDCCHNDPECDDGKACTTDTCTNSGCSHYSPDPNCVNCTTNSQCGGRCDRACIAGICADVTPITCKAGTSCRLEADQPVCRCSDSRGCDD